MLRVKDFTWHPGYMELNEAELDEPMRGEVKLRRVKRHYHERAYGYEMPVTPDALEVARRASTWLLVYMWRRALFAVQYEGMSEDAKRRAGWYLNYISKYVPTKKTTFDKNYITLSVWSLRERARV